MNILDMLGGRKTAMPTPETALPGRAEPMPTAETHFVNHHPLKGPYPEGSRDGACSASAASGARSGLLEDPRRLRHRGRLCRRLHAQPDLPGGLQRPHRPQRGRAGRLRSEAGELRGAGQGVLRGPRPDPGHAPGQRRRHAVPLRHLCRRRRPAARSPRRPRPPTSKALKAQGLRRRSPPRSSTGRRSTSPRTITSSTSPRTRTAIAASAAPASPARSGIGVARRLSAH